MEEKEPEITPGANKPIPIIGLKTTEPQKEENNSSKGVPRSTLIIFWIFIGYLALSFVAAVYFITTTKTQLFNLNRIASLTSNITPKSIDLPLCTSEINQIALRTSMLENEYAGRISSFQRDIPSSQSSTLNSSITLDAGGNLFTYFISNNDMDRLTLYNPRDEDYQKNRTIQGVRVGDSVTIRETLNLKLPPAESKTKIEVEIQ